MTLVSKKMRIFVADYSGRHMKTTLKLIIVLLGMLAIEHFCEPQAPAATACEAQGELTDARLWMCDAVCDAADGIPSLVSGRGHQQVRQHNPTGGSSPVRGQARCHTSQGVAGKGQHPCHARQAINSRLLAAHFQCCIATAYYVIALRHIIR